MAFEEFEAALSDLAFALIERDQGPYIPYRDALAQFSSSTLLEAALSMNFLEMKSGHVRFAYEALAAYFAARALTEESIAQRLSEPIIARGGTYVTGKWDPSILVFASLAHNPDALILGIARRNPFLALECIANGINVSERLVEPILGELIQVANISHQDARVATATILARVSNELALPILLEAMRVGHWHVRQAAALALWEIEIPRLEGLTSILQELEHDVEDATNTAVRHLGANALPTLLQLLHDERWKTRRSAAWALGQMKDRAAVPGLVHTLADDDNLVSAEAAHTLGLIKDAAAVPRLLESLRHPHWRVRRAAAQALGAIGTPALRFLLAVLNDKEEEVRRLVVHALKAVDDPEVAPALLDRTHDDSAEVRAAAVDSLRGRVDGPVLQRLVECLNDSAVARWNRKRVADLAAQVMIRMSITQLRSAIEHWYHTVGQSGENRDMDSKSSALTAKQRLMKDNKDRETAAAPDSGTTIKAFYDEDWRARRDAVRGLAGNEPHPVAILLLMRALEDPQPDVRVAAINGLASLKDDTAINTLLRGLKDSDDQVIDAVLLQVQHLGSRAIRALVKLLEHPEALMRARSADALGRFKARIATQALVERLDDAAQPEGLDKRVCDYAVQALQSIGSEEALSAIRAWESPSKPPVKKVRPISKTRKTPGGPRKELLSEMLSGLDKVEWGERETAAKALREYAMTLHGVQDPHIVSQLAQALAHKNWVVRWAAAEAMAWIGDPGAVPSLIQRANDKNWMVRVAVIRAMLEIGDTSATDTVLNALSDENNVVREAAAEALGALGGSKAIRGLSKALNDKEPLVRLAATVSLGNIDSKGNVRPLLRALGDSDANVRWTAAWYFAEKPDEQALPALLKCLNDAGGPYWEDSRICDLAAKALKKSQSPEVKTALEKWMASQAGQV